MQKCIPAIEINVSKINVFFCLINRIFESVTTQLKTDNPINCYSTAILQILP